MNLYKLNFKKRKQKEIGNVKDKAEKKNIQIQTPDMSKIFIPFRFWSHFIILEGMFSYKTSSRISSWYIGNFIGLHLLSAESTPTTPGRPTLCTIYQWKGRNRRKMETCDVCGQVYCIEHQLYRWWKTT